MLRQIAPKFGRIWNGRQHSKSSLDLSKRSFMNVSMYLFSCIFLSGFLGDYYLKTAQILALTSLMALYSDKRSDSNTLTDPIHGR